MNCLNFRGLMVAALAAGFGMASAAVAQERSVLDRIFGNEPQATQAAGQEMAQGSPPEWVLPSKRLEQQNRDLTGTVEQLHFRNRQLESKIRGLGAIPGVPPGASAPGGLPQPAHPPQPTRPTAQV